MSFQSLGDFAAFPSLGTNTAEPVYHHTEKYAVMEKPRNHPVMEMTYLLD